MSDDFAESKDSFKEDKKVGEEVKFFPGGNAIQREATRAHSVSYEVCTQLPRRVRACRSMAQVCCHKAEQINETERRMRCTQLPTEQDAGICHLGNENNTGSRACLLNSSETVAGC